MWTGLLSWDGWEGRVRSGLGRVIAGMHSFAAAMREREDVRASDVVERKSRVSSVFRTGSTPLKLSRDIGNMLVTETAPLTNAYDDARKLTAQSNRCMRQ